MRYVDLNLEHPRIGSGHRRFFVVREGRKRARLFYVPACVGFDMPVEVLKKARDVPAVDRREAQMGHGYLPKHMARRLRDNLRQRRMDPTEDAKAVLAALGGAA